ncbi:CMP-N,N'-diacetyllegionaminic acid synthase [Trichococcus flocculiformis]|uniref:acylneuraminate cytidylyltransferase family protein n=1 Tax=Trichococcus TaxID=82802 RepID=UPI0007A7D25D|nr:MULTISPECIES: acylneuraminate cytidylyltransferase family protein [Trichococcus]CZR10735.1 acylneuraminate cytidylyltransferase [Trichococcus sp. ES5]SHG24718.1 CMP-N,N'-diacetyllegionaminic acid synthase [Trichococcus flocculiformis]
MNILMTICGRAGSKGLKGKNLKSFNGYPLISYTLAAIDLFKQGIDAHIDVALNTDSTELQDMVGGYPDILLVERKVELAGDSASKIGVIKDTYLECKKRKGIQYDVVIDLDLTSPMRTVKDIENLLKTKIDQPLFDVVFSVVDSRRNPFFNMVKEEGDFVSLVNASTYTARQQAPKIYDMNASMYLYDPEFLEKHQAIFEGNCGIIKMKDYLILDIDSEEDFIWMSYLYEKFLEEDTGIKEIYDHIPKLNL